MSNYSAKYSSIMTFTKKGNLLAFASRKGMDISKRSVQDIYGREREIQLVASIRVDNGKIYCQIKCPVNPLPIKGEFEIVSPNELRKLLENLGWEFVGIQSIRFFM